MSASQILSRPRRHSGATAAPPHLLVIDKDLSRIITPPPRPKSTPAHERPLQRRKHNPDSSESEAEVEGAMQIDRDNDKNSSSPTSTESSTQQKIVAPQHKHTIKVTPKT